MKRKRKIAVILGSKSDLKQCYDGLLFLKEFEESVLKNTTIKVYIRSVHRNTLSLFDLLKKLSLSGTDVIITAAGWANHLSGCTDAYLRYTLRATKPVVVGVSLQDDDYPKHTHAAMLSVSEVPGTQVIFADEGGQFIGPNGFFRACQFATMRQLPEIKLPEPKEIADLNLDEALIMAQY
ncbi:MAG: AIR carboxylase family protein [Patescibacteria group bacterium]|jgi:phosphoribosylcarboxyaminoimidazole (NCAIR) mutase